MALRKAMILVSIGQAIEPVSVLFNPTEYSLDSSNKYAWHNIPGLSAPIAQFITGEATQLTMDLFLDTYEQGEDVRTYTKKITSLLDVDKDLHAPPVCKFIWGSLDFKGVIERVTQKFTMFLESGIPVRATLNVTFRSYQTIQEQFQGIPRQSADRTKQKVLKQDEYLWMISQSEYETPTLWRAIAKANGIDNPRKLKAGQRLTVPRLE